MGLFSPNAQNSFRANFKRKYEGGRDFNILSKVIPYSALRERKTKPKGTFRFKGESYLFIPSLIREYDNKGRPILKYYLGNHLPIVEKQKEIPKTNRDGSIPPITEEENLPTIVKDKEGNSYTGIDSKTYHRTFDEGEMKSVIASSQKEPEKLDWKTLIVGIAIGGLGGAMVMIFVYPSIFPHLVGH